MRTPPPFSGAAAGVFLALVAARVWTFESKDIYRKLLTQKDISGGAESLGHSLEGLNM